MVRLSKVNPSKHESRNKKKRKARHADRYAEERITLDALKQGNYHVLIANVDQQLPQAGIDIDYSDGHEQNSGDQSTSQVNTNDILFIAAARARDRDIDAQILADNRKKAMSKLFTSYLWLREKTGNWTSELSFEDFSPRFCKCDGSTRRIVAWIDLVDLTGQQRVKFKYCDCMPCCVQVLANGFLASSPVEPSAAFSMRLQAYHNYAWHHSNVRMKPFAETQRVSSEERSEFLWNKNMTAPRDLTQCLTKTVWLYCDLLGMGLDLVQATLRLTDTQKLAVGTCPACFGPSSGTGLYQLPSVLNRLVLSLDGNFQLRHHKRAGRQSAPLVTPEIFVQPRELDDVKEYITQQERLHRITKKADKCADSHKAGNDVRNESTWKACDDTGIMGSCCQHDSVVFLANIHGTGENRALPLAILKRFLASVGEDRPVGVLYDLGCSLDKYIDLRSIWPESRDRVQFGTSVFHAYVHEWPCQVKYNPRYQQGWGLSDAAWLRKKFEQALIRRDLEKTVISELVQTPNPNTPGRSNYTIAFFRSQWQDQVRVALEKNDTDDQQKKMNEFLDNEEVLESYRARMARGEWPTTLAKSNEMFQAIEQRGKAQRALAASLGTDYTALRGQCQSELSLLTLLWKAKSDLYTLAVTVRAEREPVMTTNAGNRLGTRLKEKIMGAINCRKNPVEKAIKLFNERRQNYLQKAMDLTDPLWNDNHFYHARAPWALDSNIRKGIKSVLFLDRVEEEVELLTQELDQSITWACEYHRSLQSRISKASIDDALEQLTFEEEGEDKEDEEEDEEESMTGDDDDVEVMDEGVDGPGGPTE
ncbi:hypothetical protein PSHT_01079 [Puccinia striiformis]|uniref:CxC1-like cysteine cluster associated with KDZ transposases domain-containing protein n=2 Tax=Puccinia striiformis TaxID=27350 RepID=A0A2S4WLG3_9BASI|nr:hypothetical protein PSHT_01079 [Puccinia striiformis]